MMDDDPLRIIVSKARTEVVKIERLRGWVNLFI